MKHLEVKCNSCQHVNTLPIDQKTRCNKCNERLFSWKIGLKNSVFELIVLLLTFTGGSYVGSKYLPEQPVNEPVRYSIEQEYAILDQCINYHKNPNRKLYLFKKNNYLLKRKICICALERTVANTDIENLNRNPAIFRDNVFRCRENAYARLFEHRRP